MSDDIITEFLRKRTIMSDFQLIEHVANSKSCYEVFPLPQDKVQLSESELISTLNTWKELIVKFSKFLEKTSRHVLTKTEGCVLYQFDDKNKLLKQAALICEIFRYPGISKNSSQLDIRKLQHHIFELLSRENEPLELVIAWGQAKQTCGLLKTSGPMADLAEVFAVIQLSVVLHTIQRIVGEKKKVRIKVLTGTSRFAMAFYPNLAINEKYDKQRQIIANFLNKTGEIVFEPYRQNNRIFSEKEKKRLATFQTSCSLVKEQHVSKIYNHILLSINWHDILTTESHLDLSDHEVKCLLPSIHAWIKKQSDFETILRRTLVCLIKRQEPKEFFCHDDSNYQKLSSFIDKITKDSAKKYIALQYTDANFHINDDLPNEEQKFIRLTVHEKRDRSDIPAIFTLGKLGGNYLSQNVTVYLDKNGNARFKSLVEILDEYKVKAVYATKMSDEQLPLSWLCQDQPICFLDYECADCEVAEILKKAFNTWLEGIIAI